MEVASASNTEARVWLWGRLVLFLGLALGLVSILGIAALQPSIAVLPPLVLLGGVVGFYLFKRPLLNLCVVLSLFPFIADFEAGIDIKEALYGMYYMAFFGYWYFTKIAVYRERFVHSIGDAAVLFFMFWMTAYIGLAVVFNANLGDLRGEWLALTMLGFYFPVKEAAMRERFGLHALVAVFAWMGIFVAFRNLFTLREIVAGASMAWEITEKGRVFTNEMLLMMPALMLVSWMVHTSSLRQRLATLAVFLALVFGLIMTQSRGYWVAFAAGVFALFVLSTWQQKRSLALWALLSIIVLGSLFFYVFGSRAGLLLAGLIDRFLSLGSAVTADVSLINRFLESRGAWERIVENPILGYGMGVPVQYFDITITGTRTRSFLHNGYLYLWYKFGIVGLGAVLLIWIRSMFVGSRFVWRNAGGPGARAIALGATATLVAMLLSAITSNPFALSDTVLVFAIVNGLVAGAVLRPRYMTGELS